MKKLKVIPYVCLFTSIIVSLLFAQNKPFPQEVNFANCIKPSASQASMNEAVQNIYNNWKSEWLNEAVETPSGYYLESGGTGGSWKKTTITEVHGWGMIVFALMAGYDPKAQEYFDGFHKLAKDHPSSENKVLMSWQVIYPESDSADASATDGDIDMVYGYILAHDQWGSDGAINYLEEARKMIMNGVIRSLVNPDIMRITLGDFVDNDDPNSEFYWATRPSDWMGDHFRAFEYNTAQSVLKYVADNIYVLYEEFSTKYSPSTGLVSDFIVKDPPEPAPKNYLREYVDTDCYKWNACRVPWRIATDYAHWGTEGAKNMCNKMVDWVKGATGNNPGSIANGYDLDGGELGGSGDLAFVAPFVAGCIVDSKHQSYLDDGWDYISGNTSGGIYQQSINLLSMLLISGNWWKAEGDPIEIDTTGVIFDNFLNEYFDGNSQTYLGAAYGYSLTENIHMVDSGGSFWYVYFDDSGSYLESDGFQITNEQTSKMIFPDEGLLRVSMYTSNSMQLYSYAGIGALILGIEDDVYYDFSNMTGMTVKAKGQGSIRIALITQDIWELPDTSKWGFYGFDLILDSVWQTTTIDTAGFLPQQWSVAADSGWTWQHDGAKNAVTQIEIATIEAGKDVIDLCIDFILYNGLQYERDFGFKYFPPEITSIDEDKSVKTVSGSPYLLIPNTRAKTITLSYNLVQDSPVRITLYDIKGQIVAKPLNNHQAKGTYTHTIKLGPQTSSGIYFVKFTAGDKVYYNKFSLIK